MKKNIKYLGCILTSWETRAELRFSIPYTTIVELRKKLISAGVYRITEYDPEESILPKAGDQFEVSRLSLKNIQENKYLFNLDGVDDRDFRKLRDSLSRKSTE